MNQPANIKYKKCKACGKEFSRWNSTHIACSIGCAIDLARDKARKETAKESRRMLQRLKTRSEWLKEAQAEFNKFIRLRDAKEPCISCGRHHRGQYHAGHYRTVGAHPELRFNEDNVHKQCAPCNNHKSGDIVNYRINLIGKIGQDRLNALEGPQHPSKLSIDDIKAIKVGYRQKSKELACEL